MIIYILSAVIFCLAVAGTGLLLGLTPDRVASDIVKLMTPGVTLRERALIAGNRKRKSRIVAGLMHFRQALDATGMVSGFGIVCIAAFLLTAAGVILAVLLGNYWLIPVLALAGAAAPFMVAMGSIEAYDRQTETELETALSIITSTYIRTGDIVAAVEQNLSNIKQPVRDIFAAFTGRASLVTADISRCIRNLKENSGNRIFREWCDTLIACQEDSSNRYILMPIVSKLTEIRLVNSEMTTMIAGCRREYWSMVLILLANIPLLMIINRDWFDALVHTVPGQIVTAFCGFVILVTAFLMQKFTKPVGFETGEDK